MEIVFLFYDGMTALDAIGPHEILCRLPHSKVIRAALHQGPIRTDSDVLLTAETPLSAISRAHILLIPGSGNATSLRDHPDILQWIRMIHSTSTWTTSVCTGSLILGAAGLLSNVRATTHWSAFERLKMWGAYPTPNRIVEDGKIVTAAGVSAGIDMALFLSEKIAGTAFAQSLQLGIEYDPAPPYDVGSPKKAPPALVDILKARMQARFEPIS